LDGWDDITSYDWGDELATEPFLLLHHEHGTDGAEIAVIDGLISS